MRRSPPWRGGQAIPSCVRAVAAGRAGLQLCRRLPERGCGGSRASTSAAWAAVGVRGCGRALAAKQPLCGPHPAARSCVCSANPPCLCSYAARARPPPTRARPGQDSPPHPLGQPWRRRRRRRRLRNTATPPPPQRNVVSAGTGLRDRAQAREARGGAREMQELDAGAPSPSLNSVHGKVDMETAALGVWRQRCRGGKELGQVQ